MSLLVLGRRESKIKLTAYFLGKTVILKLNFKCFLCTWHRHWRLTGELWSEMTQNVVQRSLVLWSSWSALLISVLIFPHWQPSQGSIPGLSCWKGPFSSIPAPLQSWLLVARSLTLLPVPRLQVSEQEPLASLGNLLERKISGLTLDLLRKTSWPLYFNRQVISSCRPIAVLRPLCSMPCIVLLASSHVSVYLYVPLFKAFYKTECFPVHGGVFHTPIQMAHLPFPLLPSLC